MHLILRFALPVAFCLTAAGADPPAAEAFTYRRPCMGTIWTIKLHAPAEEKADAAAAAAFARVEEVNQSLSDYLPDSALSRLSATAGKGIASTVSGDLKAVLEQSLAASRASRGAFDITIGPCVQLWRESKKSRRLPAVDALAAALASSGWEALKYDPAASTATLTKPGMRLDAGGIAKGYAQDEAMKVLKERFGVQSALIDCGSPLVSGRPPGREGWNIGLAKVSPDEPDLILQLENACADTSGDLHQAVEIDGRRYSHIIDPRTGLGLTVSIQATVVSASATEADWLATALCIMGPDDGLAFLKQQFPKRQARIVQRLADGGLKQVQTEGFTALLKRPGEKPLPKPPPGK